MDAYPLDDSHKTTVVFGINGGYEWVGAGIMPAIALGLALDGAGNYDYAGQLIETAIGSPSSVLYDYRYRINTTRLMAEAQFTWWLGNFTPFINIGAGSSWNRMSGYKETPVDYTGYVALPAFKTHTNAHFAYQAGLGIGYAFNFSEPDCEYKHERVSIGYRYIDLGNASFEGRGAVYPYSLDMHKLTANEFYLTYTHLF